MKTTLGRISEFPKPLQKSLTLDRSQQFFENHLEDHKSRSRQRTKCNFHNQAVQYISVHDQHNCHLASASLMPLEHPASILRKFPEVIPVEALCQINSWEMGRVSISPNMDRHIKKSAFLLLLQATREYCKDNAIKNLLGIIDARLGDIYNHSFWPFATISNLQIESKIFAVCQWEFWRPYVLFGAFLRSPIISCS